MAAVFGRQQCSCVGWNILAGHVFSACHRCLTVGIILGNRLGRYILRRCNDVSDVFFWHAVSWVETPLCLYVLTRRGHVPCARNFMNDCLFSDVIDWVFAECADAALWLPPRPYPSPPIVGFPLARISLCHCQCMSPCMFARKPPLLACWPVCEWLLPPLLLARRPDGST